MSTTNTIDHRAVAEAIVHAPNAKSVNRLPELHGINRRIHPSEFGSDWYLGTVERGGVYHYGTFREVRSYAAGHVAYDLGGLD